MGKPLDDFEFALREAKAASSKRLLTQVGTDTGLDYSWLVKFANGKIPGASYIKVKKLADHFRALPKAAA